MNREQMKKLVCPKCGLGATTHPGITVNEELNKPTKVTCERCGDYGSPAYFTPAEPLQERVISRQIDVDAGRTDEGHAKAIKAAMDLLVQAAHEEGLDIRWETLRMVAAPGEGRAGTTYVVVVKAWERRHAKDAADLKMLSKAGAMYEYGFITKSKPEDFLKVTGGSVA